MKKTIIVAMSGGVDSSVSCYKLLEEGYNVIGLTLDMGRPCDKSSIIDAKKVADKLKIEHFVKNIETDFSKDILDYFVDSYLKGETPNPCVKCNKTIKFKFIIDFMNEINADYIATGHYAKIIEENNYFKLMKGDNERKDQSYFLSQLPYNYLQYIKFPLNPIKDKEEVRVIAEKIGLSNARKNDSQDICFIDNDYKEFINKRIDLTKQKNGLIKHLNGEVLGEHNGIINYTIGQRRGLNVSYKTPIYVVKFDIENNIVYVGEDKDLFNNTIYLKNYNKLFEVEENKEYTFKLRSTHNGEKGKLDLKNLKIILNEETRAITNGQVCCVYDGDCVVGSGWIINNN